MTSALLDEEPEYMVLLRGCPPEPMMIADKSDSRSDWFFYLENEF